MLIVLLKPNGILSPDLESKYKNLKSAFTAIKRAYIYEGTYFYVAMKRMILFYCKVYMASVHVSTKFDLNCVSF